MMLIQILLTIFFLFALAKVIGRWRAKDLSLAGLIGWALFWLAAAAVALLPNSTATMAKLVGIGRGADLVVYAALAGLFFLIFKLMVKIERLNKDITKLARKIALDQNVIARSEETKQSHVEQGDRRAPLGARDDK